MLNCEQITHVVVNTSDEIWSMPCPTRHHNVLRLMIHHAVRDYENEIEGFLDKDGNFLNRKQAYELAVSAGQINRRKHTPNSHNGNELYSEDLW